MEGQNPLMKPIRMRILIEGQLQGLNFRLATQKKAQELQLLGFIRYLSDGRLEIEAQGPPEEVEALLTWCQTKPHAAHISHIFYRYDDPLTGFAEFTIRR